MTLGDRVAVLRDGMLEQVDTPLSIYRRPATRFVADFIGMPPMNWFDGRLEGAPGGVRLVGADFRVDLGAALGAGGGRAVAVGVRPQDLTHGPGELRGRAEVVEPLGASILVHARSAAGSAFRLLLPPEADVAVGAPIAARIDPARLHLFDTASGRRLD